MLEGRKALAAATLAIGAALTADDATAEFVRFATFNASLNRNESGQLLSDLSTTDNAQAKAVAEIIQRIDPDVLLINEFDYDANGDALRLFQQNYLGVSQNGAAPTTFAHAFAAPSNTGVPSGFDLDNNGAVGGGNDAFGFGLFPGQFGMAVYSKHDIDESAIRTFQTFLWKDMPDSLLTTIETPGAGTPFYSPEEQAALRLSSKSHWDVPITIDGETVHLLASHPTPPVFDGPEDRNGKRNHDEIRFWADYVAGEDYFYDDQGRTGGLSPDAFFVIAGDMNADPFDGDSFDDAVLQLLDHPRIDDSTIPSSAGGPEQAANQGLANASHDGDPSFDTADFADSAPGNLRVDYVLPSVGLARRGGGVFWPLSGDPLFPLVGTFDPALPGGFPSSDHRAVWIDVAAPTPIPAPAAFPMLIGALGALGLMARRSRA